MTTRPKTARLAAGEIEILDMLWRIRSASLAEAHEALPRKVGYTTVQTRLNRLVTKGLAKNRGELGLNTESLEDLEGGLPDVLKSVVRRLQDRAGSDDGAIARQALYHLYKTYRAVRTVPRVVPIAATQTAGDGK